MSPKIGIDARMWGHPGIGRYIRETSTALAGLKSLDLTLLAERGSRPEIERLGEGVSFREARAPIYGLREQFEMPLKTGGLDLLHVPHFNIPVFYPGKLVVTIHDLTYLREPGASRSRFAKPYTAFLLKRVRKKASAVIAVSEYSRRDLLDALPGLNPEKVTVVYEAASPKFRKIEDPRVLGKLKTELGLEKPFVLFVGSLKAHKNIPALIRAMARLALDKKIGHELVLVGKDEPENLEVHELAGRHAFVRFLGPLDDEKLVGIYSLAELFVLPSLREGFGLPVLEAMACGTPVLAANRTSLPEVGGDAALYFDPGRIDALAELIYNVLQKSDLRKKMSERGLQQAARFSWRKTAEKTAEVYRQALA